MNWWDKASPTDERKTPWLHPAVVAYLDSLLDDTMSVIEHGCGASTLWFAERAESVIACDSNAEWLIALHDKIAGRALNVRLLEASRPPIFLPKCDLLLIDGNKEERPAWIEAAPLLVKQGGIIVIDNAEREAYQFAISKLATVCSNPMTIKTRIKALGDKLTITVFFRLGGEWI